jgi:glutathione S-transferase
MRIAGYGLPVSAAARTYVEAHLACPHLRAWRDAGEAADRTLGHYDQGLPAAPFPMPPAAGR